MSATLDDERLAPHGGTLVDRFAPPAELERLRARAETLPRIALDGRERADLELIATGAASPLTGFLGSADYRHVLAELRLRDGTVWPLPLTLAVSQETRALLRVGGEAALVYDNRLWGVIQVEEIFERDPLEESRAV